MESKHGPAASLTPPLWGFGPDFLLGFQELYVFLLLLEATGDIFSGLVIQK